MKRHRNGSITLTRQEIDELNTAYHNLYNILTDQPADLADYFAEGHQDEEYKSIVKWSAWLDDREYHDYDDGEEETEEDRFIDAHIYEEDMEDE